jgi:hypothetical protein
MNGWIIAAGTGDAFFSGLMLGIATGILTAPVLRSWLVWRGRSEISRQAGEGTEAIRSSEAGASANGCVAARHSSGRPTP